MNLSSKSFTERKMSQYLQKIGIYLYIICIKKNIYLKKKNCCFCSQMISVVTFDLEIIIFLKIDRYFFLFRVLVRSKKMITLIQTRISVIKRFHLTTMMISCYSHFSHPNMIFIWEYFLFLCRPHRNLSFHVQLSVRSNLVPSLNPSSRRFDNRTGNAHGHISVREYICRITIIYKAS